MPGQASGWSRSRATLLHERETDAAAVESAPARGFDASEALEDMRQIGSGDADAGIVNGEDQPVVGLVLLGRKFRPQA